MKPEKAPVSPPTMIVPPFMSIPVRDPTDPRHTRSPPRIAAPNVEPAFFSMTMVPAIMFSPHDQPTRPWMRTFGPSMRPIAKYPSEPSKMRFRRLRIPTPRECLPRGFRTTMVPYPSFMRARSFELTSVEVSASASISARRL